MHYCFTAYLVQAPSISPMIMTLTMAMIIMKILIAFILIMLPTVVYTNIRYVVRYGTVRNSVQCLSVFLISNSCHPWSIYCMKGGDTSCYGEPTFSVYPVRFILFINLIT